MKTVQMTLDEELVTEVDTAVAQLGTTRSAFTRQALRSWLASLRDRELERRHKEGYSRHPVERDELGSWEDEQVWVD